MYYKLLDLLLYEYGGDTMKIYQYFINDKTLQSSKTSLKEKYPLYAITTKKIYSEIFEISRDMSKFIKKVYKGNGDDSSVIDYLNNHRGEVLDYYELDTRGSNDSVEKIQVLMTDMEYANVDHITQNGLIIEDMKWISPAIFSPKMQISLTKCMYTILYIVADAGLRDDFIDYLADRFNIDGILPYKSKNQFSDIYFDQLKIFVELNIDKLSSDFMEAICDENID